ncbi:MAG TPA: hypothetical protein PLG79_06690 [Spirochaetales bacterium]|nr:hypothetical protein [Spirochaetales bacterium]
MKGIANSSNRGGIPGTLILLALFLGRFFFPVCSFPQTLEKGKENQAVFVRGPVIGKGLPFLGPNVIPYEKGEYEYQGTSITVYFIRRSLPVLESWTPVQCGRNVLYQIRQDLPEGLIALSPKGFSLLFLLSPIPWRCTFIEAFLNRFTSFFQNLGPEESPFPAFIEIR